MNDKKYKIWSVLRVISLCILILTLFPVFTIGFADKATQIGYVIVLVLVFSFTLLSFLEASHFKNLASGAATTKKSAQNRTAIIVGAVLVFVILVWTIPAMIRLYH